MYKNFIYYCIADCKSLDFSLQNRLQRCVMECNDKIKDHMGPNPTQSEVDKFSADFESCATKCVDTYCDLLPALEKTMKKVLGSKQFE